MKALPLFRLLLSLSATVTVAAGSSIGGDGSEMGDGTHLRGGIPEGEDFPLGHYAHFNGYVRGLAEELGIGLNETARFLIQRQDFVEHTMDLHEDANFLDAELARAPDGEFVLRYKDGDVPRKSWEGVDRFKEKHGDAVLNVVSTRLSLKDALERARRLSDILKKKAYTSVSYEIYGDDIHVTAQQPRGQGQGQGTRLLTRADAASIMALDDDHDDLLGLSLNLVGHDPEAPHRRLDVANPDDAEYYKAGVGGTYMLENDSKHPEWQGKCTSGFAVKKVGSDDDGILTAGHCPFWVKYRKKKKSKKRKWVPMIRVEKHEGKHGDFGWYSRIRGEGTSLHMKPYIFAKGNPDKDDWALFPVWGTANEGQIKRGSRVFCYSRNNEKIFGYDVDGLKGVLDEGWGGTPTEDHIVLKNGKIMEPGDSGGPCWAYTYDEGHLRVIAVGIIAGSCCGKKPKTMLLTKIWNAEEHLGVEVLENREELCSETEHPCSIPLGDHFV